MPYIYTDLMEPSRQVEAEEAIAHLLFNAHPRASGATIAVEVVVAALGALGVSVRPKHMTPSFNEIRDQLIERIDAVKATPYGSEREAAAQAASRELLLLIARQYAPSLVTEVPNASS